MNANEIKKEFNLRHSPAIFSNKENAFNSLNHKVKSCYCVVLGSDYKFWVVCFSDAMRLEKLGYELAI